VLNRRQDPSPLLPLGASAFHILLALADGERHGYSIGKAVESTTAGHISLGPGTLYRQLKQMATDGWIVESDRSDDDAMRRRYYRLSPWGRRIAQAEATRLAHLVDVARARRLLPASA
jgi:DNA-binding PadR family transcriptional regulator